MKRHPHIKKTPKTEAEWFQTLLDLARFLRSPEGCPWDRKQTSESFAKFVREEASELVDSFDEPEGAVAEEWGDTLFTLLASAAAAETEGLFSVLDALEKTHAKMVRRHGHIFGAHKAETPEDVVDVWNYIKSREKEEKKRRK